MLRTIAFVIIMTAGLGACVSSAFGAFLFYVWFSLFRPVEWLWIDVTNLRLSLILGVIFVGRSLLTGTMPNLTHPISLCMVLLLLTGLIAQHNAVDPGLAWAWLDLQARLTLVTTLGVTLLHTKQRVLLTLAIMCVALGFHTTKAGLASMLGGGVQYYAGLGGSFVDNNGYALAAVMILPFLIAVGQNARELRLPRPMALGFYAAVPLTALTAVSLFSRGAFAALAVSIPTLVLLQKRRVLALVLVGASVILAIAVIPIPKGYFERIETIQTYEETEETSALGRLHIWQVAWQMAKANPLGVGVRNFNKTYDKYDFSKGHFGAERAAHNSHLQVLTEYGFGGLAVWIVMFLFAARIVFRMRCASLRDSCPETERHVLFTLSNALLASMTAFLVGGTFISLAVNELTWFTFAIVAASDRVWSLMVRTQRTAAVTK